MVETRVTTTYGRGIALNVGAAVAYSMAGLFTRLIELDVWTMLFWRGLFAGLFLAALVLATERKRTASLPRRLGIPGLGVVLASAGGMICYVHALRRTSVADVAVIYAASPLLTAALVRIRFAERQRVGTLATSGAALVGVLVMIGGDVGEGHVVGDALAFGMTLCMAVAMIAIHRHPQVPMVAAAALSSFLTALCVAPFASLTIPCGADLGKLAAFGGQLGLGQLLLTLGTRLVPATVSALIGTLDAPLAPLWVWLSSGEVPAWRTMLGGAIVMTAVVVNIMGGGGWIRARDVLRWGRSCPDADRVR